MERPALLRHLVLRLHPVVGSNPLRRIGPQLVEALHVFELDLVLDFLIHEVHFDHIVRHHESNSCFLQSLIAAQPATESELNFDLVHFVLEFEVGNEFHGDHVEVALAGVLHDRGLAQFGVAGQVLGETQFLVVDGVV